MFPCLHTSAVWGGDVSAATQDACCVGGSVDGWMEGRMDGGTDGGRRLLSDMQEADRKTGRHRSFSCVFPIIFNSVERKLFKSRNLKMQEDDWKI